MIDRPHGASPSQSRVRFRLFLNVIVAATVLRLNPLHSQPLPERGDAPIAHRRWTTQEGAPFFVQSLAQGKDGFLWLGSIDGLYRFDGLNFERIPPPPGHRRTAEAASALLATRSGDIWVGYAGHGGVGVYRSGRLIDVAMPAPPQEVVVLAEAPDGAIWAICGGGDHGVMRYARGKWSAIEPDPKAPLHDAIDVMFAADGTTWLLSWNRLWFRPRGQSHFILSPANVRGGSSIAIAANGALWITDVAGTRQLPAYDRGEMDPPRPIISPTPASAKWFRTTFDRTGFLWGTTVVDGAFRMALASRPTAADVTRFNESDGLSSDRASAILADRQGNIWIGTERGIDRYSEAVVQEEALAAHDASMSFRIAADKDGSIYFEGSAGLFRATPGGDPVLIAPHDPKTVALCTGYRGGIWRLSGKDAFLYDGDRRVRHLRLPPSIDINSCVQDAQGRLWLPDAGGILDGDERGWRRHAGLVPSGESGAITIDDAGRVLATLDRSDIIRLDGKKSLLWSGVRLGFEQPTALSTIGADVYVGGLTGLLRIRGDHVAKLDIADHPWLRDTRGIKRATDGSFWLITRSGIIRIAGEDLVRAFERPRAPLPHLVFDDGDGRVGMAQRSPADQLAVGGDGRIWFLTRRTVLHVQARNAPRPPQEAPAIITSFDADGSRVIDPIIAAATARPKMIRVAFTAINLRTPESLVFRYRLEGVDSDWVDAGQLRQATYTNLGPGNYRFRVMARETGMPWSGNPTTLDFRVAPAFYQTWWFFAACLAFVLVILWQVYAWRLRFVVASSRRRAEDRLAERERIARELHDTLLQGMQGLVMRFQAIARSLPEGGSARGMMNDALERADDVLLEGRNRVRELRATSRPTDLAALLRSNPAITDLWTGRRFRGGITVIGKPAPIRAMVADEIAQIINEAVFNAARHAKGKTIEVSIRFDAYALVVSILDDGIGFDEESRRERQREGHFGLVGMRERAARMSGELRLGDSKGGGASVILIVPNQTALAAPSRSRFWGWPTFRRWRSGGV